MKKIILLIPLLFLASCGSYNGSNPTSIHPNESIFFNDDIQYEAIDYSNYVIAVPYQIISHKVFKNDKVEQIVESLNSLEYEEISMNEYMTYGGTGYSLLFSSKYLDNYRIDIHNNRYANLTENRAFILDSKVTLPEPDEVYYEFSNMANDTFSIMRDGKLLYKISFGYDGFTFKESNFTFDKPNYIIESQFFGKINCYDNIHFTLNDEPVFYELSDGLSLPIPIE